MSSGQTIRIGDPIGFPEVSAVADVGTTIDISNMNDFDLGLLGNQRKMSATPPRPASPSGGSSELREVDNIEFVNLDDTNVTYDVRPTPSTGDTIKIIRDNVSPPKPMTLNLNPPSDFTPVAPTTSSVSSVSSAPVPAAASGSTAGAKGWFGFGAPTPAAEPTSGGISGWFGGGAAVKPALEPVASYLSPEQEAVKKSEGLTMLERMDRKGIGGTKMTVANSLDEINAELARRKDSKGLEASLRFQRSMMTTVTSGLEFLNSRYDPLGVSLDGWSEQINENIEDYDEIFEELYDKYKDKTKVAPEVRLVMSLGLSAAMCHLTNTMFKSRMPGMDDIMRKNPDLARQMARAAAEQAVGPGFANFMSMAPNSSGNASGSGPSRPMPPMPSRHEPPTMDEPPMMSFMSPMGSGMGAPIQSNDPRGSVEASPATARREMRGPSGVADILAALESAGQTNNRSVPTPAMDAEDLGSVMSGQTTETQRRAGVSRRRKATVAQPMGSTLTLNV
jgi:hypothetical protein